MPSLRFFKKRRSLQAEPTSGGDDASTPREPIRLTYAPTETTTTATPGPRVAAVPPTARADLVSSNASSSDEPAMAAPTVATGPGHLHADEDDKGARRLTRYSSRRDTFRRFHSLSTQSRTSGGSSDADGSSGGGGGGGGGGRSRLSWTAQRNTSSTPHSDHPPQAPVRAPTRSQEASDERGEAGAVEGRVGAKDASPAAEPATSPASAQAVREDVQQPQGQQGQQPRPHSIFGTPTTINSTHAAPGGGRFQRLRRLPSISLTRGLSISQRKKPESPQVISAPSPPISTPGSASLPSRRASQSPSANHNKPLPPTPSQDDDKGDSAHSTTTGSASRPNRLRLNRIMATLSDLDIEKLFSGAPQYFARSEGHFTGAPHPSVAFPWDDQLAIRDLTDHVQIEDEAWGCLTAWPHITRDVRRGPSASATRKVAERRRAHFYPRCRERPNMLSMQGLEKGTMGYQAALELGVADALQEEQWGFGSLGVKDRVINEARKNLITSKEALRRLDETAVLDHLMKNASRYQEKHTKDRASCHELFNELFTQILHPPKRTYTDPFSLSVQIQSLLKVLAQSNVWIDFSHVEWRIRLGQILWGAADDDGEDSVSDGASITEAEDTKGLHEERYWLLLQILLACELLVRLDTITEGDEIPESVKPSEIHRFERDANSSVKWSLHLARAWLENIEITKTKPSANDEAEQPKGWLANLTQKMSLTSDRPHSRHHDSHKQHFIYVMRGKYWERQVRGLTHFARRLKWPDIETQSTLISDNCRAVTEGTPLNTPLATPLSMLTAKSKDSSYFALNKDSTAGRKQPRRQKVGAALHPAGWLSKSYVSGLMLPGEGLYHFIMSTLLENDLTAMSKLGPMANLCGGFVYNGKSFWSTACVVGRVLAAGNGAVECMGWISSDVVPYYLNDGWVNIDVEDIPEDVKKTGKQARIWGKLAVERESSVLGGSAPDSVFPADFIIPYENNYKTPPPTISVELISLDLTTPLDSLQTTPTLEIASPFSDTSDFPEIKTYMPSIKFNVTTWEDDEDREFTFSVAKDVYFVTAHPCVPSHHVRILKSPSSPTIQQIDLTGHPVPGNGRSSGHAKITCHPLHKNYTYTSIHLSELLAKETWTLEDLLANSSTSTSPSIAPSPKSVRPPRVLVIDAMTNFMPQPEAHDIPLSPVTSRASTNLSEASTPPSRHSSLSGLVDSPDVDDGSPRLRRIDMERGGGAAEQQMHSETRRRQFGSDMEIMVRAICAERGWNALISRRRRGCLACAIREAGAIGWRVVIRVD